MTCGLRMFTPIVLGTILYRVSGLPGGGASCCSCFHKMVVSFLRKLLVEPWGKPKDVQIKKIFARNAGENLEPSGT